MKLKNTLLLTAFSLITTIIAAGSLHAETPAQFAALQAQVVALQKQVTALQQNNVLALAPFVTVDANPENGSPGPHITFHGANIHIVNGMGSTALMNGLGNLIIGYDENPDPAVHPFPMNGRAGSHNVVIGRYHAWFQNAFGNLIAGEWNWAINQSEFVAGFENQAVGNYSSILGGENNEAFSNWTVIVGGEDNLNQTALQVMQ
jgi:hypothetical protein